LPRQVPLHSHSMAGGRLRSTVLPVYSPLFHHRELRRKQPWAFWCSPPRTEEPQLRLMIGQHHTPERRSSDIRVIISAYQTEKLSDDHPYIWRYTGPKGSVIFDHPYNADSARVVMRGGEAIRRTDRPVLAASALGCPSWICPRCVRFRASLRVPWLRRRATRARDCATVTGFAARTPGGAVTSQRARTVCRRAAGRVCGAAVAAVRPARCGRDTRGDRAARARAPARAGDASGARAAGRCAPGTGVPPRRRAHAACRLPAWRGMDDR
jgi:hypothetical protein